MLDMIETITPATTASTNATHPVGSDIPRPLTPTMTTLSCIEPKFELRYRQHKRKDVDHDDDDDDATPPLLTAASSIYADSDSTLFLDDEDEEDDEELLGLRFVQDE
mmetsp:Transcript_24456/g.41569  ORF Transcript_24456/g.41569 Transcript_24456/m.41569 type:complete len:107 (-) Transcript_24456:143-463(-)